MGWRGVGWGGMLTFMWRSWCYVDLCWWCSCMVQSCESLKVPCFQVNHQHKEYAFTIRKVPKGLPKISGTQTIDSDWKSLKCWLPKEASKKRHWWLGDPLLKIGANNLSCVWPLWQCDDFPFQALCSCRECWARMLGSCPRMRTFKKCRNGWNTTSSHMCKRLQQCLGSRWHCYSWCNGQPQMWIDRWTQSDLLRPPSWTKRCWSRSWPSTETSS